jgi:ferric-dicitrate binding protein FerR (iron transport regulator)
MNNNTDGKAPPHRSADDEAQIAALMRQAGQREQPTAAHRDQVRAAVHAEWLAAVNRRRATAATRVGRYPALAVAAAVVLGVAVWLVRPAIGPQLPLAALERAEGEVQVKSGGWLASWQRLTPGVVLAAGTEVRTTAGGRVALRVNGISVRLDENSAVAMQAPDRVALARGALYLDSGSAAAAASTLLVQTPVGAVEHLGTQYEARLVGRDLQLRVREGRVRLRITGNEVGQVEAGAGEQLTLSPGGAARRTVVARSGGAWSWAETIAPEFQIEGRTLSDFLAWVSRETGEPLTYDSVGAEQASQDMILHGSVRGLAPREALAAVLMTTRLRDASSAAGLRIELP